MIDTIFTRGSSFIPLPDWVANKKACTNVKNEDDLCFKYSVQCGFYELYKKDHPCDMYHYKKHVVDTFIKSDNAEFPVGNDEIELFEEQNKHISVNVYYINPDTNSKTILLHKRSNNPKAQHKIDLIKLDEGNRSHYTLQALCQNWVAVLRSLLVLLPSSIDRHLAQDIIEVQDLICDCTHS